MSRSWLSACALALVCGCGGGGSNPDGGADGGTIDGASATLDIQPATVTVPFGRTQTFVAQGATSWQVSEGASGGSVDALGNYTAPATPGTYHVVASGGGASGTATVTVADFNLSILAGTSGGVGYADGTGAAARFRQPTGAVGDGAGNVYVADTLNGVIRKIDTNSKAVTTVAGTVGVSGAADGVGPAARFTYVSQMTIDAANHVLYFIDGNAIRKLDLATNAVTTLAGSVTAPGKTDAKGSAARFHSPGGIAYDGAANLFVADTSNYVIRQVATSDGTTSTLAGNGTYGTINGTGTVGVEFTNVAGLAYDAGTLYVADAQSNQIRAITVSSKLVSTLAGSTSGFLDQPGLAAKFAIPTSIVSDHAGTLYVADAANYRIRKITISGAAVSTVAGNGTQGLANGTGTAATFANLMQLALEGGNLYVTDYFSGTVRQVTLPGAVVTDFVGDNGSFGLTNGPAASALFSDPAGVAVSSTTITLADQFNYVLRQYDVAGKTVSTFTGAGSRGGQDGDSKTAQWNQPTELVDDGADGFWVADPGGDTVRHVAKDGSVTTTFGQYNVYLTADGNGTSATFGQIGPMTRVGSKLYIGEGYWIRQLDTQTKDVKTVAGDPAGGKGYVDDVGNLARFTAPGGLASDGKNRLFVSDQENRVIREIDLTTFAVTTLATTDTTGELVRFTSPSRLAFDGTFLYVVDGGLVKRVCLATRMVNVFFGQPNVVALVPGPVATAAINNYTNALVLDPSGALVLTNENAILRFGM